MQKIMTSIIVSALFAGTAAFAADNGDSTYSTSTTTAPTMNEGKLSNELVSIKPQVGVLAFTDNVGQSTSRGAVGLAIDLNSAGFLSQSWRNIDIGPSTGIIFSHLGAAGGNFFGSASNNTVSGDPGSNLLLIPADLKAAYTFADNFRIGVHGGGNVIYRSTQGELNLGPSSNQNWNLYPNAGGDVEIGIGKNVLVSLRPDFTFTKGDNFFTGMLGLGVSLG